MWAPYMPSWRLRRSIDLQLCSMQASIGMRRAHLSLICWLYLFLMLLLFESPINILVPSAVPGGGPHWSLCSSLALTTSINGAPDLRIPALPRLLLFCLQASSESLQGSFFLGFQMPSNLGIPLTLVPRPASET